jgi:hypothetical protein
MSTLALKANVFYDIKMEYKQIIGNAFARLFWASASVTKELIPSSQFYYETQTQKSPFGLIISPNAASGVESIASGKGWFNSQSIRPLNINELTSLPFLSPRDHHSYRRNRIDTDNSG